MGAAHQCAARAADVLCRSIWPRRRPVHGRAGCDGELQPGDRRRNGLVSPTFFSQGYGYTANTAVPGPGTHLSHQRPCTPLYGPGRCSTSDSTSSVRPARPAPSTSSPALRTRRSTMTTICSILCHCLDQRLAHDSALYIPGDVNHDNVIHPADALMALRIANGRITPTPGDWAHATSMAIEPARPGMPP